MKDGKESDGLGAINELLARQKLPMIKLDQRIPDGYIAIASDDCDGFGTSTLRRFYPELAVSYLRHKALAVFLGTQDGTE